MCAPHLQQGAREELTVFLFVEPGAIDHFRTCRLVRRTCLPVDGPRATNLKCKLAT
jgi:hypothetical protein